MKPNQLALALITAAGLLAACSDEPKKPEKGTKTEQTAADLAQQAEDCYKANITLVSDV